MIIVPLVIGAIAVVITLCYASYLDIIDRRVPFITWVPLLLVGIPGAGLALLSFNNGIVLLAGYAGITSPPSCYLHILITVISVHQKQLFWPVLLIALQICTGHVFFHYRDDKHFFYVHGRSLNFFLRDSARIPG